MNIAQIFLNSLLTGSIYVLIGIGLSMVFSILGFANFAHAEQVTFGAYVAFTVNVVMELNIIAGAAAAFILSGLLCVASDYLVFKRLRIRGSEAIPLMISSIGLGMVIRYSIREVWGPAIKFYNFQNVTVYSILNARITEIELLTILSSFVVTFLVHLLLTKTKLGKAMRAVSDNPTLAQASGINIERVIMWVWFIGGGLAGLSGVLRGIDTRLVPLMGWELILPAFAVIILGGIGSFYGAILGAYIIGFAENFGVVLLSELSISTTYRPAISFLILILIILIKPTGLMGLKGYGRK
jgi:branched-subunit amino acid ABC-type transport system permease component